MSHQSIQSPFLCNSTTHIFASALLNANCLQYQRLEHECNKHAVLLKKSARPVRMNGRAYKTCTVMFGNLWSVIATCTESESLTASTMKWVIWKFSEMSGLVLAKVISQSIWPGAWHTLSNFISKSLQILALFLFREAHCEPEIWVQARFDWLGENQSGDQTNFKGIIHW